MADEHSVRVLSYVAVGHSLSHAFLLFYPTVVLALSDEFAMSYDQLLPLSLGAFIMYGLGALPAGWLGDRSRPGARAPRRCRRRTSRR